MVSNQDTAIPVSYDELIDKVETGYVDAPQTPKTTSTSQGKTVSRYAVQSVHMRECLAEFLGTFVMIVFGMGVNNQVVNSEEKNGTWLSINMCWGVAVLIGVYCSEGISGANLNTAVTLAHCVYGRLPWWKAPGYMISQLLGAFCGAFIIYVMQYQNLNVVDPNRETTQGSWSTYPSDNISNYTAFYTEFIGTAMLV
ncbi:Aquaporin, partial [Phytophthora palmivora]